MTISTAHPPTLNAVKLGDRLERFKTHDAEIRAFLRQGVQAGYAWREIVNDSLWNEEYESLEAYVEALREAYNSIGYKQVMFLIGAVNLRDELANSGAAESDLEMMQSTRAHRALKDIPEADRPEVLERAAQESRDRGYEEVSGTLVERAASDLQTERETGLTLGEVQKLFAPYGTFRQARAFTRKARPFRYEFLHGPNMHPVHTGSTHKLFKTLEEALTWYAEYCQPDRQLTGPGCLTCTNCQATDAAEIWCRKNAEAISLQHVWEGMRKCPGYNAISGEVEETPLGPVGQSEQVEIPAKPYQPKEHSAGMLGTAGAKGNGTDEHYTPEKYWQPALEMLDLDEFDLDPATFDECPIPARVKYTKERSGLTNTWNVSKGLPISMWANFPYSMNAEFTREFEFYFKSGVIGQAFLLEKTDNGVDWYKKLLDLCTSFLLVNERIKHLSPDGGKNGGFFSSTLFYFGDSPEQFHDAYSHLGAVCQVMPREMYAC